MSEDLRHFDVSAYEPEICIECLVCGEPIPIGPLYSHYVPKICAECKRRLIHVLYPEREEDKP